MVKLVDHFTPDLTLHTLHFTPPLPVARSQRVQQQRQQGANGVETWKRGIQLQLPPGWALPCLRQQRLVGALGSGQPTRLQNGLARQAPRPGVAPVTSRDAVMLTRSATFSPGLKLVFPGLGLPG